MSYLVSVAIPALVGALIGLAAIWLLGVPLHSFRPDLRTRLMGAWRKWLPSAGQEVPAAHQPSAGVQGAVAETLSARLYRLDAAFAPTTHTAAHPRDLGENKDFLEAAGLLKADSVPLDTVLDFLEQRHCLAQTYAADSPLVVSHKLLRAIAEGL